jgi:5'-deoxynucleotidase YfbR-like HD superfamily hydrolase/nucleoside phosphorylase
MFVTKVDCALIFAIEEEFNIVRENNRIEFFEKNYFKFHFLDRDGISRECITTYVSEPGSHEAYKFLRKFYEDYLPDICFIIGISGLIDDDFRIGDICIANSVQKYDYNSKLKDGQFKFSGKLISTPYQEEFLKRLPNVVSSTYKKWQLESQNHFESLFTKHQQQELVEKGFVRRDCQPSYRYGNIATGEGVVDDKLLKKAIQDKDRKLLCVDMESFGFADVVDGKNLIIIRAISDTADGRKKELDNFGDNPDALRKWALQNAYDFFYSVVLKNISFPNGREDKEHLKFNPQTNADLDRLLKIDREGVLLCYSNLFAHLFDEKKDHIVDENLFKRFLNRISKIEGKGTVFIQGNPGSGKSTFLYLLKRFLDQENFESHLINIHNYKHHADKDCLPRFERDIDLLLKKGSGNCLIIDGVDQFERFFVHKEVRLTHSLWRKIHSCFDIVVLGITTQDYENEEDENKQFYLPEPTIAMKLTNFKFDTPVLSQLVDDLLYVNDLNVKRKHDVLNFIQKAGVKDLDWYTINVLVQKVGNFNYVSNGAQYSMGGFLFNYLKDFFSSSDISDTIASAAQLTFRKFIRGEQLKIDEYTSSIWLLIQKSSTIKQFLISEHLVNRYSALDSDFNESKIDLEHIYSYKINSYFKDNINRGSKVKERIFKSITNKYEELNVLQRPNVCYILGRLEGEPYENDSRRFLDQQLKKELRDYRDGKYRDFDSHNRQHLLLLRTIFISLVYLGSSSAAEEYVDFLLSSQEWDDLNRGFHLEYYGDKKYDPEKLGLHCDDLDINFPETCERLTKKILAGILSTKGEYLMLGIELQTLTSLAVNRHLVGKLDIELKEKVSSLLIKIQFADRTLNFSLQFRSFIDAALYILSNPNASINAMLKDLYNIKKIKRAGWNYSGIKDGIEIIRSVKEPESVPEHIYGAVIMALLFLPNEIADDKTYAKSDVIETLLIHDLAEAFIGDIPTFNKTEDKRKQEDEKMQMIFSWQVLKGFTDMERYRNLWYNYVHQNTTTARIAKELDRIEQLFQLTLYNTDENVISDQSNWQKELEQQVHSSIGKTILRNILVQRK